MAIFINFLKIEKESMVNVLKFQSCFCLCSHKNVAFQGWNSQMLVRIANREDPLIMLYLLCVCILIQL